MMSRASIVGLGQLPALERRPPADFFAAVDEQLNVNVLAVRLEPRAGVPAARVAIDQGKKSVAVELDLAAFERS